MQLREAVKHLLTQEEAAWPNLSPNTPPLFSDQGVTYYSKTHTLSFSQSRDHQTNLLPGLHFLTLSSETLNSGSTLKFVTRGHGRPPVSRHKTNLRSLY